MLGAGNPPFNDPSSVSEYGRKGAECIRDCASLGWSGNWAAVVGIILCILMLSLWLEMRFPASDEEESLIDPGGK